MDSYSPVAFPTCGIPSQNLRVHSWQMPETSQPPFTESVNCDINISLSRQKQFFSACLKDTPNLIQEALLSPHSSGELSCLPNPGLPTGIAGISTPHSSLPQHRIPGGDSPILRSLGRCRGTSLKLNGDTSLHMRKAAASPRRVSLALRRFLGKDRILQGHTGQPQENAPPSSNSWRLPGLPQPRISPVFQALTARGSDQE